MPPQTRKSKILVCQLSQTSLLFSKHSLRSSHSMSAPVHGYFEVIKNGLVGVFARLHRTQVVHKGDGMEQENANRVTRRSSLISRPQTPSSPSITQDTSVLIEKTWKGNARSWKAPGLANVTNSCFAAATLQCLMHLAEYCQFMAHSHTACNASPHKCVPCALRTILSKHWPNLEMESIRPIPTPGSDTLEPLYCAALKTINPLHVMNDAFENWDQADASDFLAYLIEELREVEDPIQPYKLSTLFDIEHETEWTCDRCGKVHCRVEEAGEAGHGVGISVNIQQPKRHMISMMSYLRANGYAENIEIRCDSEKCVSKTQLKKAAKKAKKSKGKNTSKANDIRMRRKFITKAPEILVIKIARFTATLTDDGNLTTEKLSDMITYPAMLDLTEFTRQSPDEDAQGSKPLVYKLQSVVAHHGETLDDGHYVAAVRQLDGRSVCTFDDETAMQTYPGEGNMKELESPRVGDDQFDPYLLFYSQVHL